MDEIRGQIVITRARSNYLSEAHDQVDTEMHRTNANTMEKMLAVVEAAQEVVATYQAMGINTREPEDRIPLDALAIALAALDVPVSEGQSGPKDILDRRDALRDEMVGTNKYHKGAVSEEPPG